ncbi:MAG: DUF2723 domain-containing protein [Candidatus Sabulitectum sp.]|nr:DUF2723 domain-containing protein [Candidatus Sabulitectum sp.]
MKIKGRFTTDRIVALAAALTAFIVYIITLAPSVSFWDSGEYITCSWVVGIPHPPGVPFFVLLGRVSTIIFGFIPSIAARVNLMCAIAGTATIGLVARLIQRWSIRLKYEPWLYRPVSAAGALMAAFSYTVWRNNNATETYAMAALLSLLILWIFDLWLERRLHGKPAGRQLLLTGYLMTLAIGNHLSALIVTFPIIAMYVLYAFRKKAFEWKSPGFLVMFAGLMVLAFSIHLYMPLRAIQNPEINETNPSVWTEFKEAIERKQYGQVSIFSRKGPFQDQLGLFTEYLSWQVGRPEAWMGSMGTAGGIIWAFLWMGMSVLAVTGLVVISKRRPDLLLLVGLSFIMASLAFVIYLNFKTGPEGTALGEVRERDYFFGASFIFFAVLSMIGLGSLFASAKNRLTKNAAWSILIFPVISLGMNWHHCDRSGDYVARDYGINLLESCPENGVIITNGDNDTFPLWFAQGVLDVRRDVIISNLSLMNTRWYVKQLMLKDADLLSYPENVVESMQPVFVWGPNFFHVSYEGLPLTGDIDRQALDATFNHQWPWVLASGALSIPVPAMGRGSQGSVPMQDLILINMIRNKPVHGREIMIAGTVSGENRRYVEDYLQMQGIAFRVMDSPVLRQVNTELGWALAEQFLTTGLEDPGVYKDDQAIQIARNYVSAYNRLAYQFMAEGNPEMVEICLDRAEYLFSAMPEEWLSIMPSFVLLKARFIHGYLGADAAISYLAQATSVMNSMAVFYGDQNAANAASRLASIAREFEQEAAFDAVIDLISDGTPAHEWIRIEKDLSFGNFIAARRHLEELQVEWGVEYRPVLDLIEETVDRFSIYSPVSTGLNMMDTALASVFSHTDQTSASLEWKDDISAASIIVEMAGLASRGNIMSAVSMGTVMATAVDSELETQLLTDLCVDFIADPQKAEELSLWFILSTGTFSPEARAVNLANGGFSGLSYAILVNDLEMEPEEALTLCHSGQSVAGQFN